MNRRLPAWLLATITVGGVLVLGFVDWQTGYELNFFVFYFAPLSMAAWFLGFGFSVALAVLSAVVWYGADMLSGHVYSSPFYAVWNTTIRLAAFLTIGWAISRVRRALDHEHHTVEELRRALSEIKVLEGLLPICAQCKKIRNPEGVWQQMEAYIQRHSKAQFTHTYCPACAKKVLEEAGLLHKQPEP